MGLPIDVAAMLVKISKTIENKETVVFLGDQKLDFDFNKFPAFCKKINIDISEINFDIKGENNSAKLFFKELGFEKCITLDVSDYEGAEIIHNLNDSNLPDKYHNVADLIIDGGTFEHVFNLPNALECTFKLLNKNGVICHLNPSNGYLDHGFYQISPTFYYDYYKENEYSILSGNVLNRYKGEVSSEPYLTDIYRNKGMFYSLNKLTRASLLFCVKKIEKSTYNKIPIQTYYREMNHDFIQDYENLIPFNHKVNSFNTKLYYHFPSLFEFIKKIIRN